MDREYLGYKGSIAEKLEKLGIGIGDHIVVKKNNIVVEGLLMPRETIYGDRPILVVKLDNGYNIGVKMDEDTEIILVEKAKKRAVEPRAKTQSPDLPHVTLLSTGGTIVSKIDYETGAVTPALDVDEILEWIPELMDIAYIDSREVMSILSENMEPRYWEKIAYEIYRELEKGVDGIVIGHGTDTMAYTAAAMAFAIRNKPVPIVFVGSQRSSDRPSTDSVLNLKSAFMVASKASFAESVVVMHGETSDTYAYVHRGVKVRKMHTSRRDAFQSINDKPIAIVYPDEQEIRVINRIVEYRDKDKQPELLNKFDEKTVLIKFYPGLSSEIIDFFIDKKYHGIVLEGTGLGHVSEKLVGSIRRAVEEGIPVVMTSQCLFGRVNMNVYSTGRKLLEAGVIPGSDMLPETAYVKLSWILGSISRDLEEVKKMITTNIVGEINSRLTLRHYPRWIY